MPKYKSDSRPNAHTTSFLADIAWGDPLFASSNDLDANVEHNARRARWQRRKGNR